MRFLLVIQPRRKVFVSGVQAYWRGGGCIVPFFNSIVTVSLAHFIKNLGRETISIHMRPIGSKKRKTTRLLSNLMHNTMCTYRTSFMLGSDKMREAMSNQGCRRCPA